MVYCFVSGLGGFGLFIADGAEVGEDFLFTAQEWYSTVTTIPWIRLMSAAFNLGGVSSSSGFKDTCAVYNFAILISWTLWFAWRCMAISEKDFPDVVLHGESANTGCVFPIEINACVFIPLPVSSDRVVFLKCEEEMLCVLFAHIFYAKVIDG